MPSTNVKDALHDTKTICFVIEGMPTIILEA